MASASTSFQPVRSRSVSHFRKMVCLHDWWLTKADKDFEGRWLAVAGYTSREGHAVRIFSSAPILKRYDVFTLETVDGIYVILEGFINKQRTEENGFLYEVFDHFVFGFPLCWETIGRKFVVGGQETVISGSNQDGPPKKCEMSVEREQHERDRVNVGVKDNEDDLHEHGQPELCFSVCDASSVEAGVASSQHPEILMKYQKENLTTAHNLSSSSSAPSIIENLGLSKCKKQPGRPLRIEQKNVATFAIDADTITNHLTSLESYQKEDTVSICSLKCESRKCNSPSVVFEKQSEVSLNEQSSIKVLRLGGALGKSKENGNRSVGRRLLYMSECKIQPRRSLRIAQNTVAPSVVNLNTITNCNLKNFASYQEEDNVSICSPKIQSRELNFPSDAFKKKSEVNMNEKSSPVEAVKHDEALNNFKENGNDFVRKRLLNLSECKKQPRRCPRIAQNAVAPSVVDMKSESRKFKSPLDGFEKQSEVDLNENSSIEAVRLDDALDKSKEDECNSVGRMLHQSLCKSNRRDYNGQKNGITLEVERNKLKYHLESSSGQIQKAVYCVESEPGFIEALNAGNQQAMDEIYVNNPRSGCMKFSSEKIIASCHCGMDRKHDCIHGVVKSQSNLQQNEMGSYPGPDFSDKKSNSKITVLEKELISKEGSKSNKKRKRKSESPQTRSVKKKASTSCTESLSFKSSRSGRLLLPTLEFWRNQEAVYDVDRQITGIKEGSNEVHVLRGRNSRCRRKGRLT